MRYVNIENGGWISEEVWKSLSPARQAHYNIQFENQEEEGTLEKQYKKFFPKVEEEDCKAPDVETFSLLNQVGVNSILDNMDQGSDSTIDFGGFGGGDGGGGGAGGNW